MSQLKGLQDAFCEALWDAGKPVPDGIIGRTRQPSPKRFNVYRNNVYLSLIEAIANRYPVVVRLVGEEFFAAAARAFVEAHPPQNPMLLAYGGAFADFLADLDPVRDLPYLPDVARLEWAWHEAYHAQDAEPLSAEELGNVPPDRISDLKLSLHPSVRLISSAFPVVSIWETNTADDEVKAIDLNVGGEDGLVLRPNYEVIVLRLPPGACPFIERLQQGEPLSAAAEAATGACPQFDLQANLFALITTGALTGYALAGASNEGSVANERQKTWR